MFLSFFIVSLTVVKEIQGATWNYQDFAAWNAISPLCAQQQHQSPRVLNQSVATMGSTCHNLEWQNSNPRTFSVKNNGHSLVFTPNIGVNESTANTFTWGNWSWCLVQFHMHWSQNDHGAEHRLENYDNGLEVHFVHRRCDYPNISAALAEDTNAINTIAVIGILYQVGPDDLMASLINTSVITNEVITGTNTSQVVNFPYTQMLPSLPQRRFYTYQGSLTTPTCDPVLWFVVESQQNVSAAEMQLLRMVQEANGSAILHNQRPLQANTQPLMYYDSCSAPTGNPGATTGTPGMTTGNANITATNPNMTASPGTTTTSKAETATSSLLAFCLAMCAWFF